MNKRTKVLFLCLVVFTVSSCATATGSLVGAGVGGAFGGREGAAFGALIGAGLGLAVDTANGNVVVATDDSMVGYEEEVEVPIVYGEPCYYPPPIVVEYPYDYYTYERVGGYVNIVFWRGGHRFHNEVWRDHGRRMSVAGVRTWRRAHKIGGSEFAHHREQLQRRHNIAHPNSYYGLKSHPNRQVTAKGNKLNQQAKHGANTQYSQQIRQRPQHQQRQVMAQQRPQQQQAQQKKRQHQNDRNLN
jgi:hypothetical protein